MQGNSRSVSSNQEGIHEQLDALVKRYLTTESRRPVQEHTKAAFIQVNDWLQGQTENLIIDSCCGVGESTAKLAAQFPDHKIIGIDKSAQRIGKHSHHFASEDSQDGTLISSKDNYCVVRADVIDFWRLIKQERWLLNAHYLLYPNPYPKASQLQKRWYACASFKDLLMLQGKLTVRSNWRLYLEEFQKALSVAGCCSNIEAVSSDDPMTAFERKYQNSGQTCWQLSANLAKINPQSWRWDG